MSRKCLWRAVATGECVTEKMVDEAIAMACNNANNNLERRWLKHPVFKQTIIADCRREEAYPSTLIEEALMVSDDDDLRSDLSRWKKRK